MSKTEVYPGFDPFAKHSLKIGTTYFFQGIGIVKWTPKLDRTAAILFAERVLPVWEGKFPCDKRPREAIEAAKMFLEGKITKRKMIVISNKSGVCASDEYAIVRIDEESLEGFNIPRTSCAAWAAQCVSSDENKKFRTHEGCGDEYENSLASVTAGYARAASPDFAQEALDQVQILCEVLKANTKPDKSSKNRKKSSPKLTAAYN